MKKFIALVLILFASLCCTACINNLAIQELNQIGKEYLDKGDVDGAISRFQSVVDLDENVFETRYNLGVAYIQKKDYASAIPQLEKAIQLNPDFSDAYYSYAVALEGAAMPEPEVSDEQAEEVVEPVIDKELLSKAIEYYNKYLEHKPEAEDRDAVTLHLDDLFKKLEADKPEIAE